MKREEQLQFCKFCMNQKISLKEGIICRITNQVADFQEVCPQYIEDSELKKRFERTNTPGRGITASAGVRFLNYFIDTVFMIVLVILFLIFLVRMFPPEFQITMLYENRLYRYGLSFLMSLVYYTIFEASGGRTIGKYITKTKVVDEGGNLPDFRTILIRTCCRFIPFDPLSFLFEDSTGWHDKLSKTRVVSV
jgi:uncharacterized RDD family membrane protein YckC